MCVCVCQVCTGKDKQEFTKSTDVTNCFSSDRCDTSSVAATRLAHTPQRLYFLLTYLLHTSSHPPASFHTCDNIACERFQQRRRPGTWRRAGAEFLTSPREAAQSWSHPKRSSENTVSEDGHVCSHSPYWLQLINWKVSNAWLQMNCHVSVLWRKGGDV